MFYIFLWNIYANLSIILTTNFTWGMIHFYSKDKVTGTFQFLCNVKVMIDRSSQLGLCPKSTAPPSNKLPVWKSNKMGPGSLNNNIHLCVAFHTIAQLITRHFSGFVFPSSRCGFSLCSISGSGGTTPSISSVVYSILPYAHHTGNGYSGISSIISVYKWFWSCGNNQLAPSLVNVYYVLIEVIEVIHCYYIF